MNSKHIKGAGILLPVFSLPNKYGIGSFGKEAYDFVDFLYDTNQNYWQILPLNPLSFGNSPYQSPGAFGGNPYFIDIEILYERGFLCKSDVEDAVSADKAFVDYGKLYLSRYKILYKAFNVFIKKHDNDYFNFIMENTFWLSPYSLFMAIKDFNGGKPWTEWEQAQKNYSMAYKEKDKYYTGIEFHNFLQYEFFRQWTNLKKYANQKKIEIIGDMPIYVAFDSADVWANTQLFCLNKNLSPSYVAGVPPDSYSPDGQVWGNPLYNWQNMQSDNFDWWIKRFNKGFDIYDVIRIDHFRGFESYYAVPYGSNTAKGGKWLQASGEKLFNEIKKTFPDARIIAENLGYIDYKVRKLLEFTGYTGMKVLQFAFDDINSEHLPCNYTNNCVAYTGTHDNETIRKFIKTASEAVRARISQIIAKKSTETITRALIRILFESKADTVIIPIWDYLENLNTRINTPSTKNDNWIWRLPFDYNTEKIRNKIKKLSINKTLYYRSV